MTSISVRQPGRVLCESEQPRAREDRTFESICSDDHDASLQQFCEQASIRSLPRSLSIVMLLSGTVYSKFLGLPLPELGALAVAFFLLVDVARWGRRWAQPLGLFIILFGALLIPAYFNMPHSEYGIEKVYKLSTITALSALSALLLRTRGDFATFIKVWVSFSLLAAAVTIAGRVTGGVAGRANLLEANPIWLGRELAVGLLLCAWLSLRRGQRSLRGLLGCGVFVVALLLTGSRGPLLAAALGMAVLLRFRLQRPSLGVAAGGFILSAFLVGVAAFFQVSKLRSLEWLKNPLTAAVESDRLGMWSLAWEISADHPWGIGWGGWTEYYQLTQWPHNLYLEVFLEAGWVSGFVVLSLLWLAFGRTLRLGGADPLLDLTAALLVCVSLFSMVSGDVNARTWYAILFIALTFGRGSVQLPQPHGKSIVPNRKDVQRMRMGVER